MSRAEAAILYEEARIRRTEGNTTGAFARYRRVLELADAAGDLEWRGEVLTELGQMYQENFELIEARRWFQQALEVLEQLGRPDRGAEVLFRLGQIERLAGSLDEAETLLDRALAAAQEDPVLQGQARVARGLLLWERKRPDEGVPEILAGYALLKQYHPDAAAGARQQIQEARQRVGALRYRSLLTAAGADPDLLA